MGKLDEQIARTAMRGGGVIATGLRALRAAARETMRPELQALGIDHIDPFTSAGQLAVQKARNAALLNGEKERLDRFNNFMGRWAAHQRTAFPDAKPLPERSARHSGDNSNDAELSKLSSRDTVTGDWGPDTFLPPSYYEERGMAVPSDAISPGDRERAS